MTESLKSTEILIYTRNSYPWQHRTEYPALHILELQFWNVKSKDKAALGKITIAQQINSSNLSLGPGAARFARYEAGKGQPRAAVTANRPLSRRPNPRTPRGTARGSRSWGAAASHLSQRPRPHLPAGCQRLTLHLRARIFLTTRASAQVRLNCRTSGHRSALSTSRPLPSPSLGAGLSRQAA